MIKLINFLTLFLIFKTNFCEFTSEDDQPCFLQPLVRLANKSLYFGVHFKANYYQALNFCRSHCMHLVSIESEEIHKAIVEYIHSSPYRGDEFWTSGNDLADEGLFTWGATGRRMNYTNWIKDQPDNHMNYENCVQLWSIFGHGWNDRNCDAQYSFICQINQ